MLLGYIPVILGLWNMHSNHSSRIDINLEKQLLAEGRVNLLPEILSNPIAYQNEIKNPLIWHPSSKKTEINQETVFEESVIQNPTIALLPEDIAKARTALLDSIESVNKIETVSKSDISNVKQIVQSGEFAGSFVVKSSIKSNFYVDARRIGIPAKVIDTVIHTLSAKVNFRRALKKGDMFEIMYGKNNELLYAKIVTKRTTASVFGIMVNKKLTYFFENGESAAPVKVAAGNVFVPPLRGKLSVSSAFGMRRHPITGVYKQHTGVDLRANYGTPIYAMMDGVVTRASYYQGYGYCVDIQHKSGYSSRYAHMSKIDVRLGNRVARGQIIGKVGMSGMASGPHLHLELARNNRRVNPFSVKMIPEEKKAKQYAPKTFKTFKEKIKKIVANI